jgi:arsenate reductase
VAEKPVVLFLCVHNAGRSQMAAGWLRHLAGDQVDVLSGGSAPAASLNPVVVEVMADAGIDIGENTPRAWTLDEIAAADVVVTMGCGDECPVVAGPRYEDWELADPAGEPFGVVRSISEDIESRVRALMATLGLVATG